MHQLRFAYDDSDGAQPMAIASHPASLYPPADPAKRVTVLDTLRCELAAVESKRQRITKLRSRLRSEWSKLATRAAALSLQIESLERNPLAILRYQASSMRLPPSVQEVSLWHRRPLSDVRLESVAGLGAARYRLLVERCPTVGDLEIFRIEEGLTSVPGVGMLLAARIERTLFKWLKRYAWGYVPAASREHRGSGERGWKCEKEIVL